MAIFAPLKNSLESDIVSGIFFLLPVNIMLNCDICNRIFHHIAILWVECLV